MTPTNTPSMGVAVQVTCPHCGGTGTVADWIGLEMKRVEVECDSCCGTGFIHSIPALTPKDKTNV